MGYMRYHFWLRVKASLLQAGDALGSLMFSTIYEPGFHLAAGSAVAGYAAGHVPPDLEPELMEYKYS